MANLAASGHPAQRAANQVIHDTIPVLHSAFITLIDDVRATQTTRPPEKICHAGCARVKRADSAVVARRRPCVVFSRGGRHDYAISDRPREGH